MSHCPKCQMPLEASSRFCGVCGAPVVEAKAEPLLAPNSPASQGGRQRARPETKPEAPRAKSSLKPIETPKPAGAMPRTLISADPPPVVAQYSAPPQAESLASKSGSPNLFNSSDPYIGTTLNNRFVVESKLGEGGFGAVYKGVQKGSNRIVALKLLHPEMTRDKNVVQRFRLEGQVLCSLKDAHTVTTYDFDQTEDGTLYIAMELLEGRSLHDVFSNEAPIPWRRMLKILSEMCSSLGEAHAMGIVHRDLKPENVHLEKRSGNDEFVKILDFGIAKMLHGEGIGGSGGPQLTATGQTLGTLEYMSPEQLMGKDLDGRSDIYGLGVLAYELITGRLPFPDAVGPAMLISAQLKKVPESPSTAYPGGRFPRDVDAMVLTMLQKMRDDRFVDVAALRQECLRILATGTAAPSPAEHAPAPVFMPQPVPATGNSEGPGASTRSAPGPSTQAIIAATSSKPRKLWLVFGLALIAVGGGVAFFFSS